MPTPEPNDDLLWGIRAIAAEINRPHRQTLYMLETGQIPAGKSGRLWVGSRRRLREHFDRLINGSEVEPGGGGG